MGRRRQRQAFSTETGRRVYRDAHRVRGFRADLAVRTHDALLNLLDAAPELCELMACGTADWEDDAIDRVADKVAKMVIPTGLIASLFWWGAEFFVRWLVRRLMLEWQSDAAEFSAVMGLADGV